MGSKEHELQELNESYADQTGHRLRGNHSKTAKILGGIPPKCFWEKVEISERNYHIRRKMRRITEDGKD